MGSLGLIAFALLVWIFLPRYSVGTVLAGSTVTWLYLRYLSGSSAKKYDRHHIFRERPNSIWAMNRLALGVHSRLRILCTDGHFALFHLRFLCPDQRTQPRLIDAGVAFFILQEIKVGLRETQLLHPKCVCLLHFAELTKVDGRRTLLRSFPSCSF